MNPDHSAPGLSFRFRLGYDTEYQIKSLTTALKKIAHATPHMVSHDFTTHRARLPRSVRTDRFCGLRPSDSPTTRTIGCGPW